MISIASEPILTFGILLLLTLVIPLIFQKLKLPGIVGLLLAGTIVGPKGFGYIEAAGVIDVLGKVGLLYLMFLAGLEIDLNQFKKERKNTFVFGALTFLIPQLLGTIIFYALGYSLPASILIASMFASHTLVAYPIISRLGLTKEKSVATAVGGTIITDTVALLVLAVVARSVGGDLDTMFWVTLVGLFSMYIILMFLILPHLSYRFFQFVGEKGRFTYVYVIGVMLMASWVAEIIGIEAIVGAFFAGLSLNQLISNKGPLKNRIEFFGDAFFIPLFLIFVGMQVDLEVLTSNSDVWIIMGVMTATVIVTKWIAAFASAKILRFTTQQAWVIFGLTNSQAAATLAAVFVGMEVGLIGEEILNGAVMMILITCIIGPIVVEKYAFQLADDITLESENTEKINQRILVPISNPTTTARLIEFAANLRTHDRSPIFPLSVLNTVKDVESQKERSHKLLEMAKGHIHAVNCEAVPVVETNLNIAEGIRLSAERNSITDIVIGWNGIISTPMRIFGSILDRVVMTTNQQIFICKLTKPVTTFKRLIVLVQPNSVTGRGFVMLFESIFKLAENLKTKIEIICMEEDEDRIQRDLFIMKSDLDIQIRVLGNMNQSFPVLVDELTESDLLFVTNSRSGRYPWNQIANMIPKLMSIQKPDSSFVIAFPYSLDTDDIQIDLLYTN